MFGLGLPEIIVIMIVALLVVGPSKLPDLARSLGKALNEFRKMADEVKETFEEEVIKEEEEKTKDAKQDIEKEVTNKEHRESTEDEVNETLSFDPYGVQTKVEKEGGENSSQNT